ncbi:MAG: VWA domain-containing protein [Acidobacteriota bacterium]|nr:VWA domain-containing protein [Acidobacteriota bacterium]
MKLTPKLLLLAALLVIVGTAPTAALAASQGSDRESRRIEEERDRPQGRAALTVEVDQVRLDVTVRDRKGNLIQGLQQEHFDVYENKVKQKLTHFSPIEAPITAVLVTEYSAVLPWEMLYEAWLGSRIFAENMRKDDWVAVVAYDLKPEILVDFTQDKFEVYRALQRLNYPGFRESNLYDTIFDVLDRIEEAEGKTAVVLLSTGLDTFSRKNMGEALDKVKRTNAVIYPISIGQNLRLRYEDRFSTTTRMDFYQADVVLKEMAKYTGGEAFFPRFVTQFPNIFMTIANLLRNQYSLGYISTNTKKDGKLRRIKVEVKVDVNGDGKIDKLKVAHRRGYLAEKRDK